ncbi:hypothetical protein [Aestuariivirga sp.]|uniref:hypothetical protein n=1 Tax=Aestuariivirga sp. TaxID=2650926 RepID=UPI003919B517
MTRKAKRSVAKARTASKKTTKASARKSAKTGSPARKKPEQKLTRRSGADVAKLQKAVIKSLKAGKSAQSLAAEFGISTAYVYILKNKG